MLIDVYTDGACSGNPGIGGWGFTIKWPDRERECFWEATASTTNNREEIKAIGNALKRVREARGFRRDDRIRIFTDSKLAINCISGIWKRKKNLDLFPPIDDLLDDTVSFHWVKGHAGNAGNELADTLATYAVQEFREQRRHGLHVLPHDGPMVGQRDDDVEEVMQWYEAYGENEAAR